MTRGRYGASAAKRRAESAEEQLDRLLPQLVDAQRTAKRYKSEAERVPLLLREVESLKRQVGMPVEQHVASMRALDADWREVVHELEQAAALVFRMMEAAAGELFRDDVAKAHTIDRDGKILEALYILGEDVIEPLLRALQWDRPVRRSLVTADVSERMIRWRSRKLVEVDQHMYQQVAKMKSRELEARLAAGDEDEDDDDG